MTRTLAAVLPSAEGGPSDAESAEEEADLRRNAEEGNVGTRVHPYHASQTVSRAQS